MRNGSYIKGIKKGPFFLKIITPRTKTEEKIYLKLNETPEIIKKYTRDIKMLNIKCAKNFRVTKKRLIQEYIKGQTVDEYINDNFDCDLKINMIKKVLDLFEKSLKNSNLRIDWNLKNFIIKNNDIILVDYVPSIYMENLNKIKEDSTMELYDLYFNLDIQLAGIIGYSICPFLELEKELFEKIYNEIYSYATSIYRINKTKEHVFIEKINLIDKYLNNKIDTEKFILKYKSMSLSNIMLDKNGR